MKNMRILLLFIFIAITGFLLIFTEPLNRTFDIQKIKNSNMSFSELEQFFKNTASQKGAIYAFELLKVVPLPPQTDIHLLAHAVGNMLYKQVGVKGIRFCTDDFRNVCSHTIVIGLFVEKGIDALSQIAEVCRKAPGGSGAYSMCFHGLGHGVLAYAQYDMYEAIKLCSLTGTKQRNFTETGECIGGMIMEMIEGVHDRGAWEKQRANFFKASDPLFPCNQEFIPSAAKNNCFDYLTPHLWQVAGFDMADPLDSNFYEAFKFCEDLKGNNEIFKESCYGGFGKEFVALAAQRDIRRVDSMSKEELAKVYSLCLLAKDEFGTQSCIRHAINSLYWGGENDPHVALNFCETMDNESYRNMCLKHVVGSFKFYNRPQSLKLSKSCKLLPDEYKNECLKTN